MLETNRCFMPIPFHMKIDDGKDLYFCLNWNGKSERPSNETYPSSPYQIWQNSMKSPSLGFTNAHYPLQQSTIHLVLSHQIKSAFCFCLITKVKFCNVTYMFHRLRPEKVKGLELQQCGLSWKSFMWREISFHRCNTLAIDFMEFTDNEEQWVNTFSGTVSWNMK